MKMAAPEFWWREKPGFRSQLLAPLGLLYGCITANRMNQPAKTRARVPLCCVGNFVVGGAGKTPSLQTMARLLLSDGYTPGFLLRGFGGAQTQSCLVTKEHNADDVGDEALLYAPLGPTVVGTDRAESAQLLSSQGIDIILMDDGFQNPSVHKDYSIVVIDGNVGWGNKRCFPAGPLRAPLDLQIGAADVLVVIGNGRYLEKCIQLGADSNLPVIHAHLEPLATDINQLPNGPFLAFCGIGRPQKFFNTLKNFDIPFSDTMAFADHHMFNEKDAEQILKHCATLNAIPITTQKDYARLSAAPAGSARARLKEQTQVLRIEVVFDDTDMLLEPIRNLLRKDSNS